MASYYGVQRSDSTLSHYGVKGMKWGIRKAIDRAYSGRPHSQEYDRVRDKLSMLQQRKFDRAVQKVQKAQMHGKVRKVKKLYNKANEKLEELNKKADRTYQRGQYDQGKEDRSRAFWWSDNSGRLMGSGVRKNLSSRALMALDNRKSKKLISDKGHRKAVEERNQYADQMAKIFSGTAYEKKARSVAKKRMRYQR